MPSPVTLHPEIPVADAIDTIHEALDLLPASGTITVSRAAIMAIMEHHAQLAQSVDALRRVIRDQHEAPPCLPCARIERNLR